MQALLFRLLTACPSVQSLSCVADGTDQTCKAIDGQSGLRAGGADDVRQVLFEAAYSVLGLGDVYLGAPCAVPVDPR